MFARLLAEENNAAIDNAVRDCLPSYDIPETRPVQPLGFIAKQIRQIAQSFESFGFNVPLLIDDQQKVIAGHGRLLAAGSLGWDTVPAIKLSHLTESRRAAFLIADKPLDRELLLG